LQEESGLKKTIIGYYLSLLAGERLNSYSIRDGGSNVVENGEGGCQTHGTFKLLFNALIR